MIKLINGVEAHTVSANYSRNFLSMLDYELCIGRVIINPGTATVVSIAF